ncbi:MFS transporter [Companilactobacillus metriopterae]|uniref:MFS transporter n=1 Tax=Companilactobacillus metriopterae TaxID=1909267 RepID=UPI00100A72DB|nr:MFS transporter [Companilactobacillus metriopterae]
MNTTSRIVNRKAFIITLLAGTFTMSISQSSLSTAYPTLMKYFNVGPTTIQWLTTGFMLVMCLTMPISPWLLNNVSFKKLYLGIISIFSIGTVIIMLAPNFPVAMLGRILEALAVGILFPSFQSVLLEITTKDKRSRTMGIAGLVMGSALASGPIISGIVLKFVSWQGLFAFFLIIMIIIFISSLFYITDVSEKHSYTFDIYSTVSLIGIVGLLYVINQAGTSMSLNIELIVVLIVSLVLSILFIHRQLTIPQPLLDLKVMKNINFDLAVLLTGFSYISLIVVTIIYPLYYQNVLHMSVLNSGLSLVPPAILLSILNPISGRLAKSLGFKRLLLLGMIIITIGWLSLVIIPNKNFIEMIIIACLIEGGNAFVMMPATTLGGNSLPNNLISHGTAIITTVRQILGSLGVSLAMIILSSANKNFNLPEDSGQIGYKYVFITFFVLALIGCCFAILIRNYSNKKES